MSFAVAVCYSRLPMEKSRVDLELTKIFSLVQRACSLLCFLCNDSVKCENPWDVEWTTLYTSAVYLSHHEVDQRAVTEREKGQHEREKIHLHRAASIHIDLTQQ